MLLYTLRSLLYHLNTGSQVSPWTISNGTFLGPDTMVIARFPLLFSFRHRTSVNLYQQSKLVGVYLLLVQMLPTFPTNELVDTGVFHTFLPMSGSWFSYNRYQSRICGCPCEP